MRDTSTVARENPAPWKANGAKGMAPPVSCHLAPPSRISRPPKKKSHLRSPMHRLSEGTSRLKAPFGLLAATRQKAGTIRWKDGIQTHFTCPRDLMQQTATTCLCHFRPIPISPPPHTHVNFARCLCCPSHMPMSLWRHAYVTLARCLCHHLRHAYVAEVRCLCRQSDIGISPAPHQKRPVYRCLGCPFFVLFGHFRHEMRIFPASEGVFRGGQ